MNIFNGLRQLSFNPAAVGMVRLLHLGPLMKELYYRLYKPRDGQKRFSFHGIEACFHVSDFEELRNVETMFEEGDRDERGMLAQLMTILQPGQVIYDIGASIGVHSIFMAKKTGEKGQVIAIEPEQRSYKALCQNVALNEMGNVTVIPIALGDKRDETGSLFFKKRVGIGSFSLLRAEESDFCQRVEIVPGDWLVESRNLPLPQGVKIDVEGYEYPVLLGLKRSLSKVTCQWVCCEIHRELYPSGVKPQTIFDFLESIGFRHLQMSQRGGEIQAIYHR